MLVRGGTYLLSETLKLGPEHSGIAEAPVIFSAYPDELPLLIGGQAHQRLHASIKDRFSRWRSAGRALRASTFASLFAKANGSTWLAIRISIRKTLTAGGWAYVDGQLVPLYQDVPGEDKRTFHYKPSDERNWDRPEEAEVFVFPRLQLVE